MSMRAYKTDLRCGACVAALRPALDAQLGAGRWRVDLDSPDKVLHAEADPATVRAILGEAGYTLRGEVETSTPSSASPAPKEPPPGYYPLVLVLAFIVGGTVLLQMRLPHGDAMRGMSDFMGLFFTGFAFFKLLDVPAFASAYAGYDWIARRWFGWGYVYPFVELTLGVLYLLHLFPLAVHAVTLVLMTVGTVGVVQTLLDGRKIRCACLGSVFNLPMSFVSLAEDLGMAVMAAAMLAIEGLAHLRT
jgi:hypothetical protein